MFFVNSVFGFSFCVQSDYVRLRGWRIWCQQAKISIRDLSRFYSLWRHSESSKITPTHILIVKPILPTHVSLLDTDPKWNTAMSKHLIPLFLSESIWQNEGGLSYTKAIFYILHDWRCMHTSDSGIHVWFAWESVCVFLCEQHDSQDNCPREAWYYRSFHTRDRKKKR